MKGHAFLIIGNDPAAIALATRDLITKAEENLGRSLEVHRHDAADMALSQVLVLADSQNLFGDPLAHIFRNPGFLMPQAKQGRLSKKDQEALLAALANPNPDSLLVISLESSHKPNAFLKKLMTTCPTIKADQPEARELGQILDSLAQDHGKAWSGEAKRGLMQCQGRLEFGRILQEAEKILLYASGPKVSGEDVQRLLAPVPEFTIFHLLDAVFEGRGQAALDAWQDCQDQGEDAGKVIYMLADQVRRLILLKSLHNQGAPMALMQKQAGRPAFVVKKNLNQTRKISEDRLIASLDLILAKDYERKTRSVEDHGLFMERLLIGLATICRPHATQRS